MSCDSLISQCYSAVRLITRHMRNTFATLHMFLTSAFWHNLQALCEERGAAVKQLELQVGMLTEKVQLLTAELNQQERDSSSLLNDLQQQLDR